MARIRTPFAGVFVAGMFAIGVSTASAQSFETAGVIRVSDSQNPAPISAEAGGAYCPEEGYVGSYHGGHGRHGSGYRFSPPVKRPIYRSPVSYTKGFPDAWTGQAAYGQQQPGYRAPTVYMPTDTTQLGYYYQVVPYWQPKPAAIPAPPIPSQWHTTVGQLPTYGHHPAGVIFGNAPTAVPNSPTPPPWGNRGVPPEPQPTQIEGINNTIQPAPLERTVNGPALLPID